MSENLAGSNLGPFRLDQRIGRGAMGAVYVGTHQQNGRRVAIKVMVTTPESNPTKMAARFEREIALLQKFRHPNIVRFYGASEDQGIRYYAMELVEGESLEAMLDREPILDLGKMITYAKQICEALQEMHATGVVHRDLKPGNVLVTSDQKVKLTDFGIARDTSALSEERLTAADHTVGTIAYMSPEQLAGGELTRKSDLYSLGLLLYRMVAGQLPFQGQTMFEYMQQRQSGIYPPASSINRGLPLELDQLLGELLAQSPEDRPKDAYVVLQRLMEIEAKRRDKSLTRPRPKPAEELAETVEMRKSRFSTLFSTVFGNPEPKKKKSKKRKSSGGDAHSSIFESPLVLVAGIVVVVAVIVYMFMPVSNEKLFEMGSAVMAKEGVTLDEMIRADTDYFKVIESRDAESPYREKIAEYRHQIAVQRARGRANMALRFDRVEPDATEAETNYIAALRLKEVQNDPISAYEKFRAVASVFANDPKAQAWVTLANEQLKDSATVESNEERREAKRRTVRGALEEARSLREQGDHRQALDKYLRVEELYGTDPDVSDLVWQAGTEFIPAGDLFASGERLMKSKDPADWRKAFDRYFEPLLVKDPNGLHAEPIERYRDQLLTHEAEQKAAEDLKIGLPGNASAGEAGYVTGLFVRDVLEDDLSAHDHWQRLIDQLRDDPDARAWVALSRAELAKTREVADKETWNAEKEVLARRALTKLAGRIAGDADQKTWWPRVVALYADDPITAEMAANMDLPQ